jgi:hypothetical protein
MAAKRWPSPTVRSYAFRLSVTEVFSDAMTPDIMPTVRRARVGDVLRQEPQGRTHQ